MFQVPEVGPQEAKEMLQKENVVLLDVRTPQEHIQLRIPNSMLIPFMPQPAEKRKRTKRHLFI